MPDRIETARLTLVPASSDDVDRLVLLDSDPEVMRFINGGRPSSRAEADERIVATAGHLFVAIEHETAEFVGWFSIRPSSPTERELGYRLVRMQWGRGLATEGSRALIDVAFEDPVVQRVWAQTMTVNTGSRRVMEHCRLQYVRTFVQDWPDGPIDGSELGDVEYELTRSAWTLASRGSWT